MINRALFLAVTVVSAIAAPAGFAADQAKASLKPEIQKAAEVAVKTGKKPSTEIEASSVKTVVKPANVTTPATVKTENSPKSSQLKNVPLSKTKAAEKSDKGDKQAEHSTKVTKRPFSGNLVPPPPPDTPTLLGIPGGDYTSSMSNFEFMSLDAMKDRQKQLNIQLVDAQAELKSRESDAAETKTKAKQFDMLYSEGVISKRELEMAQKDAGEVDARISRSKIRVEDLQSNLNRLAERLKDQEKRVAKVRKSSLALKGKNSGSSKKAVLKTEVKPQSSVVKAAETKSELTETETKTETKTEIKVEAPAPSTSTKSDTKLEEKPVKTESVPATNSAPPPLTEL